jgi:hypothetical protein
MCRHAEGLAFCFFSAGYIPERGQEGSLQYPAGPKGDSAESEKEARMDRLLGRVLLSLFLLITLVFFGAAVYAQTGQGTLTGSITDSSGAVIPAVAVVIKNEKTGFTYNAVTNEQGIYRVPYLNAGMYEVTYEATGFRRLVRSGVQIRSTETLDLDITLEVGNIVESVEVSAGAQLLETETSTTGHLVSGVVQDRREREERRRHDRGDPHGAPAGSEPPDEQRQRREPRDRKCRPVLERPQVDQPDGLIEGGMPKRRGHVEQRQRAEPDGENTEPKGEQRATSGTRSVGHRAVSTS